MMRIRPSHPAGMETDEKKSRRGIWEIKDSSDFAFSHRDPDYPSGKIHILRFCPKTASYCKAPSSQGKGASIRRKSLNLWFWKILGGWRERLTLGSRSRLPSACIVESSSDCCDGRNSHPRTLKTIKSSSLPLLQGLFQPLDLHFVTLYCHLKVTVPIW